MLRNSSIISLTTEISLGRRGDERAAFCAMSFIMELISVRTPLCTADVLPLLFNLLFILSMIGHPSGSRLTSTSISFNTQLSVSISMLRLSIYALL